MSGEITHSVMDRLVPTRVSSFFATHRFRPTLLLTVATVALAALAIALGNWQRHRADEKSATATLAANIAFEMISLVALRRLQPQAAGTPVVSGAVRK